MEAERIRVEEYTPRPTHPRGGKLTNLVSFAQLLGSRQNISQSVQNHIDGFLVLETNKT
jgi:hypothetical protein